MKNSLVTAKVVERYHVGDRTKMSSGASCQLIPLTIITTRFHTGDKKRLPNFPDAKECCIWEFFGWKRFWNSHLHTSDFFLMNVLDPCLWPAISLVRIPHLRLPSHLRSLFVTVHKHECRHTDSDTSRHLFSA